MKITYTAGDGSVFNSSDECLAYEEQENEAYDNWSMRLIESSSESEESLWDFILKIQCSEIQLESTDVFWTYRRRFIELAKSFEEIG